MIDTCLSFVWTYVCVIQFYDESTEIISSNKSTFVNEYQQKVQSMCKI